MGVYANINGSLSPITGMPSDMVGATASTPGEHGLAPAPLVADRNDFLRGDGTWGDNNFIGTMNEWDTLSVDNKTKYKTADITSGVVPPTPPPPTPTATYTITYYANGGSGIMRADTKIEDVSYVIRDNKFVAPFEKEFINWNTSADGSGTTYNADDIYTVNADLTLYAVWDLFALKFSSDGNFTLSIDSKNWDGTVYYSVNNGASWSTWNGSQLSGTANQPIYMRGKNNTSFTLGDARFSFNGKYCTGNIETLLDYEKVINNEPITMRYYCYSGLFYNCTELIVAPRLPATVLSDRCYQFMFENCTSLTTIPKLPAVELKEYCYYRMFKGCTSLKLSTTQTGDYQCTFRMPTNGTGTGTTATDALTDMFANTGGTFTGTPSLNTIYYTDHAPV